MESNIQTRDVFYVSDGTAITCETLGRAVIAQFSFLPVERTFPFVESEEKLYELIREIEKSNQKQGVPPMVLFSMVLPEVRDKLLECEAHFYDVLAPLIQAMQTDLQLEAKPKLHRSHSVNKNAEGYFDRIAAVEYTLAHDDGISLRDLDKADLILLGVSRSGKTPTSVYMAMQFGLRVVNYPFIEEDLKKLRLLPELEINRHKLFGLTIKAERLTEVRSHRLAESEYASADQCISEVNQVEAFFRREAIPYLDTSNLSIEEISARILERTGVSRNMF
ncbi:kinase/pyrophosphorylase [Vibrio hannami]|uniref:posphoenolpyruvate synthetase regulatory kinase/phosphorylase PpsR n=1 Tax=Vibrio hannami TaxID=2717094 RepID=UPI0024109219|nr:pyruvate, water dikinase regulatory protein [Vibrio hannami]MDG3087730.1 kinase/pyrophosphorylase [Vibrio hannami]